MGPPGPPGRSKSGRPGPPGLQGQPGIANIKEHLEYCFHILARLFSKYRSSFFS